MALPLEKAGFISGLALVPVNVFVLARELVYLVMSVLVPVTVDKKNKI